MLLELIHLGRMSDLDKDLGIILLRYQLGTAERRLDQTIRPDHLEKLTVAVLVNKMKSSANRSLAVGRIIISKRCRI